jgi:hypothetical protein
MLISSSPHTIWLKSFSSFPNEDHSIDTTQPATSPLGFLSSLLNILGPMFGSGSGSKGGQSTPTPSPAYLSSQGYPTSQQNAGTFSVVHSQGYLVSVDPKTCRPPPDCTGHYSGNISDVTTAITPFHSLTFISSLDQAKAASLNGRWITQPANPPASSSWRFNFWPFSNNRKPCAQPQADPSLILINPALGAPGSVMNFGALVLPWGSFRQVRRFLVLGVRRINLTLLTSPSILKLCMFSSEIGLDMV